MTALRDIAMMNNPSEAPLYPDTPTPKMLWHTASGGPDWVK
jgi:hypothetical protein